MVFSSELRIGKPKRAFYEKALALAGEVGENCLFIDDLVDNVIAAECIGMKGFVFSGDAVETEQFIYANS